MEPQQQNNLLGFHHKTTPARLQQYQLRRLGWWGEYTTTVTADANVVDALAAQLVGRSRDTGPAGKLTIAYANNTSLRMHKNITGLRGEALTESITYAAAIAFSRGIAAETAASEHTLASALTDGYHLTLTNLNCLPTTTDRAKAWLGSQAKYWVPPLVCTAAYVTNAIFQTAFGNKFVRRTPIGGLRHAAWYLTGALFCALGVGASLTKRFTAHQPGTEAASVVSLVNDNYAVRDATTILPQGLWNGQLLLHKKEYDPIPEADCSFTPGHNSSMTVKPAIVQHLSLACPEALPVVPSSSPGNETVAIQNRLGGHDFSRLDPDAVAEYVGFQTTMLDSEFPALFGDIQDTYAAATGLLGAPRAAVYAEWNAANRVSPSVAAAHDRAVSENQRDRRFTSDVTLFIKSEPCFPLSPDGPIEVSAPRPIQNTSQNVHVTIGPYFYCFSKLLAASWNPQHWCCYASGITSHEASAYVTPGLTYYVGDVSRFDRGLVPEIMASLHGWRENRKLFSTAAEKCCRDQLSTKWRSMKGRHSGKYVGQRRSGDDNTSVDNTLLNITAHVWAVSRALGLSLAEVRARFKFIALGDDIVVIGPPELASVDFDDHLSKIGWKIKPKIVEHIDDVEFCSRLNWPSSAGRLFATKPGRFFARYGYAWDSHTKVDVTEKAYALQLGNNHVPFVRKLLAKQLSFSRRSHQNVKTPEWALQNPGFLADPTTETWTMLYNIYGLTPQDEADFERTLETWTGGPALISHPALSRMFSVEGLSNL